MITRDCRNSGGAANLTNENFITTTQLYTQKSRAPAQYIAAWLSIREIVLQSCVRWNNQVGELVSVTWIPATLMDGYDFWPRYWKAVCTGNSGSFHLEVALKITNMCVITGVKQHFTEGFSCRSCCEVEERRSSTCLRKGRVARSPEWYDLEIAASDNTVERTAIDACFTFWHKIVWTVKLLSPIAFSSWHGDFRDKKHPWKLC